MTMCLGDDAARAVRGRARQNRASECWRGDIRTQTLRPCTQSKMHPGLEGHRRETCQGFRDCTSGRERQRRGHGKIVLRVALGGMEEIASWSAS